MLRELSLRKDNWNIYVGDPRYKTNFFLQFLDSSTKLLYEKSLLEGSPVYSLRCLLIGTWILLIWYLCYTEQLSEQAPSKQYSLTIAVFVTILAAGALFGTITNQLYVERLNQPKIKKALIVRCPS